MKHLFLKSVLAVLCLMTAVLPAVNVSAQTDMELQPGIVISMVGIEEHLGDMEYLMEACGPPVSQMAGFVRIGASEWTRGIDTSKPIGAMLFFDEDTPEPKFLAFIPVEPDTGLDDVLDTIAPHVDMDDSGDPVLITTPDGTQLSITQSGGFAFVTDNPEFLKNLPNDPVALLEGMQSTYNLSAKLFGQRIPESLRAQGIEWIRQGAAREMENLDDTPQAELQRQNFEYSMKQIEQLINETEEVVAGFSIDQENKRVFIDVSLQGIPGSKFAKQSMAMNDAIESKFTGFLDENAAMNFHMCAKVLDEDIPEMERMLKMIKEEVAKEIEAEIPDEDQQKFVQKIVDDLIDVTQQTFQEGVIDAGGILNLDENRADFALGMRVADPTKLESSLKSIAEIAKAESDVPIEFKFDASKENGITYHEVIVEIPADEEEMRDVFGESVTILVGIGDKAVYIAGGKDPKTTLNNCIGRSDNRDRPPMQFNLRVSPLLRFFAKTQNQEQLSKMAESLQSGSDRVSIVAAPMKNGQKIRIEMQDGIFKLFGIAAQEFGGGFGPRQDF